LLNDGTILVEFASGEVVFSDSDVAQGHARANLAESLIGDNAYFNRIAINRISMRFISPYPLFQTRRFR
jgi:hypothetical protein